MNLARRKFCRIFSLGAAGLLLKTPFSFLASSRPRNSEGQRPKGNKLKIKVIGLGDVGTKSVDQMMSMGLTDINFTVLNTDQGSLAQSLCPSKVLLGGSLAKGNGCGMNPEMGYACAQRSRETIARIIRGNDAVILVAGLGGGTGTGGAPVVSGIAKGLGAVSTGVVTMPFHFEGRWRSRNAQEGLKKLEEASDLIIPIPNESIFNFFSTQALLTDVLAKSLEVMSLAASKLTDLLLDSGSDGRDFRDKINLFSQLGLAYLGIGGNGERDILRAAQSAIHYPLLKDVPFDRARKVIYTLRVCGQQRLIDVRAASRIIEKSFSRDTDFISDVVIDKRDRAEAVLFVSGFARERTSIRNPET